MTGALQRSSQEEFGSSHELRRDSIQMVSSRSVPQEIFLHRTQTRRSDAHCTNCVRIFGASSREFQKEKLGKSGRVPLDFFLGRRFLGLRGFGETLVLGNSPPPDFPPCSNSWGVFQNSAQKALWPVGLKRASTFFAQG